LETSPPAGRDACFYRTVFHDDTNPPAVPAPSLSEGGLLPEVGMRLQFHVRVRDMKSDWLAGRAFKPAVTVVCWPLAPKPASTVYKPTSHDLNAHCVS
jgi:hypothetical protein